MGNGPLDFEAVINIAPWTNSLARMNRQYTGLVSNVEQGSNQIDNTFRRLGQLAAGTFAFKGLAELPQQIFKVRGEFQQLETSFTAILKSKEKADALFGDIKSYSLVNPSSVLETAQAAKQLLAYGISSEKIIPTITKLGDLSAGVGSSMKDLAYLIGTTFTQGRVYVQDYNQFVGRGIPLGRALSETMGVAESEVRGLVEAGKVGFPEIERAIDNLTKKGSIFGGLALESNKKFNGLASQFADAWEAALDDIGQQNEGLVIDLVRGATSVVQNYRQVIDILKVVTVAYGSYRAAILLATVAQAASVGITRQQAINNALAASSSHSLTLSQVRQAASTSLVARAQAALNTTMLANPYALVFTALAALTTAYFVFKEETQQVKSAQELLAEASKDAGTNLAQQKAEVDLLVGVLKNQNVAESERLKAYNRLKEISPDIVAGLDFERAKTADLTKEVDKYLISLEKKIRLESRQGALKEAFEQDRIAAENLKKANDDLIAQGDKLNKKRPSVGGDPSTIGSGSGGALAYTNLKQKADELARVKKQTEGAITELKGQVEAVYTGGSKEFVQAQIDYQESVLKAVTDKKSLNYKIAEDELKRLRVQYGLLTAEEKKGQSVKARGIEQIDKEIKAQKQLLDSKLSDAKKAEINKKITDLQTERANLQGKRTPAQNRAAREIEKAGAVGSAQYYEDIAKKASEALERTAKSDTTAIAKQTAIRDNALRQAADARKAYEIKSFEDELDAKREQYEVYQRWVTAYGESAADAQFSGLVKNGQTYLDYLNTQIAGLENERDNAGLSDKQTLNLDSLIQEKKGVLDSRPTDQFTESLARAKEEAGSLSSYLEYLYQEQEKLSKARNSPDAIGNRMALSKAIVQTENEVKDGAAKFLVSYAGSEQQATAIKQRYADLRLGIEKRFGKEQSNEKTKYLDIINKAESGETKAFKDNQFEQSEEYKKLSKVILEEGRKRLAIEISNLEAALAKAKDTYGEQSEEYKRLQLDLRAKKREKDGELFADINTATGIAQQFGEALSGMGGEAGEAGQRLVALASQANLVNQAFKKGLSAEEAQANAIQVGVQGIIGFVTALTSAAAERKRVETDFYTSVNNQQREYILLQNEQLGLKGKDNVFYEDYEGKLKAGFTKYTDAQKKYQESLSKLNEGRVKAGLTNTLDGKTALSLVGGAAATGAGIGTLIAPGIGTLIGGAIGGIVGSIGALFGGAQKKEEQFVALLQQYPDLIKQGNNGVVELNKGLATSLLNSGLLSEETKGLVQSTLDWSAAVEAGKAQIREVVSSLASGLGDKLRDSLINAFKGGKDAAEQFSDDVGSILEDLVTKMLFSKTLGPFFDTLQNELSDSLTAGDGNVIDDFERFVKNSQTANEQYSKLLSDFQIAANKAGFKNVLTNPKEKDKGLSGAISASLTEATANILEGQINAIRITQAQTQLLIRDQLLHLSNISRNTGNIDKNTANLEKKLDKIVDVLKSDPLRAKGLPG